MTEPQHDDLDSSSSGLTEPSESQTSSDSGSSGSYPSELSGGAADSDAEADGETVTVDFEFFDAQEGDFHGLKALLQTYLDGEAFSCSELVDAIIQQVSGRLLNAYALCTATPRCQVPCNCAAHRKLAAHSVHLVYSRFPSSMRVVYEQGCTSAALSIEAAHCAAHALTNCCRHIKNQCNPKHSCAMRQSR